MRLSKSVTLALGASAALSFLSACSSGNSGFAANAGPAAGTSRSSIIGTVAPHRSNSVIIPAALRPHGHAFVLHPQAEARIGQIFASRLNVGAVNAYQKGTGPNNPLAFELQGALDLPQGMTTDAHGTLYIANTASSNVLIYPAGSQSPTQTLSVTGQEPADVAVARDGTIYTANIVSNSDGPGSVSVFAPGAKTPTATLNDANFNQVVGVALDRAGGLYVSYGDTNNAGHVAYFAPGKTKAAETGITLGFPGGVGFDTSGHLLVADQFSGVIGIYDPGNPTAIARLTLPGDSAYFAFDKTGTFFYVSDFNNNAVEVFKYSIAGLTLINTITNGINQYDNAIGIATTPSLQP